MRNDVQTRLSLGKKLVLAAAAMCAFGVPVVVGLAAPGESRAQENRAAPVKIQMREGKRVKLDFDGVEVRSLVKALAEAAQVNVLVSDKVVGHLSVHLDEMPWRQALDIVLKSQGLVSRDQDGIILVSPDERA